jgi:hypothetical protein
MSDYDQYKLSKTKGGQRGYYMAGLTSGRFDMPEILCANEQWADHIMEKLDKADLYDRLIADMKGGV